MCGKYSQIHPVHSLFVRNKKWLVLTEQSICGKFQLIRMSSYAKNKPQMYSVTQHQCRWCQMWRKCSQIHKVHSLFVRTCPDWTIYSLQGFNSLGCLLMLRTNYRCVQWLNISVDVTKCVEKGSQIHTVHSLFDRYKKWLVFSQQSIHGKVSTQ